MQLHHAQLQLVHQPPPEPHLGRLFLVSVVCSALQPQQQQQVLRAGRTLCRPEHQVLQDLRQHALHLVLCHQPAWLTVFSLLSWLFSFSVQT